MLTVLDNVPLSFKSAPQFIDFYRFSKTKERKTVPIQPNARQDKKGKEYKRVKKKNKEETVRFSSGAIRNALFSLWPRSD